MKTSFKHLTAAFLAVIAVYSCKREITSPAITNQATSSSTAVIINNAVFKDLVYGTNTDSLGEKLDLTLDLYLCSPRVIKQKFPLVVYVHAGGFYKGDKIFTQTNCELLNSYGFISATINYRLGREIDSNNICSSDVNLLNEAHYRAIQDLRAALRYLVANAYQYGIDTHQIFIEGESAGACICLEAAYLTQDSANYYFPGASVNFGNLNDADNNLKTKYAIKGIASKWGAVYSQYIINSQ